MKEWFTMAELQALAMVQTELCRGPPKFCWPAATEIAKVAISPSISVQLHPSKDCLVSPFINMNFPDHFQ